MVLVLGASRVGLDLLVSRKSQLLPLLDQLSYRKGVDRREKDVMIS